MRPSDVRCALVTIHGIGNQPESWFTDFNTLLSARLTELTPAGRERLVQESIWWADLSQLGGLESAASTPLDTGGVTYTVAYQQYTTHLAASEAMTSGSTGSLESPIGDFARRLIGRVGDKAVTVADHTNDVANYISNNGVRLAIQRRLSDRLIRIRADHPNATIIVGSHSQGTIIALDVLRLLGPWLGPLTWVTMGSPLGWYLNFARWGADQLGLPAETDWLNLFDLKDIVGKALAGLVRWGAPRPQDINVDNVAQGLDAHDHWHNPVVADRYFQLIEPLVR